METLVLKSDSKKDLTLLLNLAKEQGLNLEVVSKKRLNAPTIEMKPKGSKKKLIMTLSKEVNKEMHKKLMKQYNSHNDSNYR